MRDSTDNGSSATGGRTAVSHVEARGRPLPPKEPTPAGAAGYSSAGRAAVMPTKVEPPVNAATRRPASGCRSCCADASGQDGRRAGRRSHGRQ